MTHERLFQQFVSFLQTIENENLKPEEFTLINLIIANFNEVVATGTAGGKRGKLVNQLITQKVTTVQDNKLYLPTATTNKATQNLHRLQSLKAERFRGFTNNCEFNFNKQFVLLFGPNGSGKSSFCESLEYALLGYINEADQKRIPVADYIKNVYFDNVGTTLLKGVDENGELVAVKNDPLKYHFNFIEKCRIDAFARISGHTSSNQKDLLSALFGLEQFNDFVDSFTDNIEKYISIEPVKENEFETKKKTIEAYQQVVNDALKKQQSIEEERLNILRDSKLHLDFEKLDRFIHGKAEDRGRLYFLQQQMMSANTVAIEWPSVAQLLLAIESWEQQVKIFRQRQTQFEQSIKDIDFSRLYEAVLKVESQSTDHCPVCETPLSIAAKHPYQHALLRLEKLKAAAALEENRKLTWSALLTEKDKVADLVGTIRAACVARKISISFELPEELNNISLSVSDQEPLLNTMLKFIKEAKLAKEKLLETEAIIHAENRLNDRVKDKTAIASEFEWLNGLSSRIREIRTEEKTLRELTLGAENKISEFNNITGKLREEIAAEKLTIGKNIKYIAAYKRIKQWMIYYKDQLPVQLVKDLNGLVKEFYNFINKDDAEHELIAAIQLPAMADQQMKISFQDQPDKFFNALQLLSEGHIKCLGLSILLAKSVHSGASFMIFDDIVNAIDDDHRINIRDLFLSNQHFADKQLIITSHSELFIEDFEKRMDKEEYQHKVQKISFLKRTGKMIQTID